MKMFRCSWLGLLLLSLTVLAQDAAMFRGDLAHTGVYKAQGVQKFSQIKWKFHTDGQVISSPAIANGAIFVGSTDGSLYAVDLESGVQKWKLFTGVRVTSSPAVENGTVYFGSYSGRFYAVDAVSGKLKWKFQTEGEKRFEGKHLHGSQPAGETMPDPFDFYLSSPALWGGAVYFGSGDGNLYALDAGTGELKWKFRTGDVVHALPRMPTASYTSAAGTATSTRSTRRRARRNGASTAARTRFMHNQVGFRTRRPWRMASYTWAAATRTSTRSMRPPGEEKWKFNNAGAAG